MAKEQWTPSVHGLSEGQYKKDRVITPDALITYDRLMYSYGTIEPKAIYFLLGLDDQPQSTSDITRRVKRSLEPGMWLPSDSNVRGYLRKSFLPTGLAEESKDGWRVYYSYSFDGKQIGRAPAALLIDYVASHGVPLADIFGSIITRTDSRSYMNRTAILLSLYNDPSFEAELMRKIGIDKGSLRDHLENLEKHGFIDYQSVDLEKGGWVTYERIGEPTMVVHSADKNRLRQNILKYFEVNPQANVKTLIEALGRQDEGDVNYILSQLVVNGFLERTLYHGGIKQSDAKISNRGKELVESLIIPLLSWTGGGHTYDTQFMHVQNEVATNPKVASTALTVYKDNYNREPLEKTEEDILTRITEGGPARYQELINELGEKIQPALQKLIVNGRLVKHKDGKGVFYLLPGTELPQSVRHHIVFEYKQPENLVPATGYPREYYLNQLEATTFWEGLFKDLQLLTVKKPERIFFYKFDNSYRDWAEPANYKSGKYTNLIIALRKFGIRNPYDFIRNYQTKNAELRPLIEQVHALMAEKLIPVLEYRESRHPQEYISDLETEQFWTGVINHLQTVSGNVTDWVFFTKFDPQNPEWTQPGNDSYGLYAAHIRVLKRENIHNPYKYLRSYIPHNEALKPIVEAAQKLIREKLIETRDKVRLEVKLQDFNDPEFWAEFKEDLERVKLNRTFLTFLSYYTYENYRAYQDPRSKPREGRTSATGKYNAYISAFRKHQSELLGLPEWQNLPQEIEAGFGRIIKTIFYRSAPVHLRKLLLEKFPNDFKVLAKHEISLYEEEEEKRLADQEAQRFMEQEFPIPSSDEVFTGIEADDATKLYLAEAKRTPVLSKTEELTLFTQIDRGRQAKLRLSTVKVSPDEERELLRLEKLGEAAFDHIIKANQNLVIWQTRKYLNRGLPFLDLVQEGNIGLMKAAEYFNKDLGFKFSTYATWWLRQTIGRAVKNMGTIVRKPVDVGEQIDKIRHTTARLQQILGHEPTQAEIAREMGLDIAEVKELLEYAQPALSLEAPMGDEEENTLERVVFDESFPHQFDRAELKIVLEEAIEKLPPRERSIMEWRLGWKGGKPHTLEEVGKKFRLTRERVWQIEAEAKKKLRINLGEDAKDFLR